MRSRFDRFGTVGFVGLLACMAVGALAIPARSDTPTTITFTYPLLPAVNVPDNDGKLNVASHTFQEGGIEAESFWVKNNELIWSQGHFHVHFPNQFEASHGGRIIAGLGPDRQGMVLRREDGGPFNLTSLEYKLINPPAANILIGTSFDPAFPAQNQLTAFPVVADANFQTLYPAGFTGVTQLFIVWELTEGGSDAAYMDNIVLTIPSATCSPSQPGGVVVSHSGLTDPTTEGWVTDGPGTGVTSGPIAADLGYDAWYVDDDSTASGGWRSYVHNLTPDQMCWARTAGFKLRSRVRVANTNDITDGSVTMSFFDSLNLFELRLGSTGSNDPIAAVSGSGVVLTGLGGGYHLYEMVYDPVTRTVDLFVDGVERLSNRPGVPLQVRAPNITFGSPGTGANGMGEGRYALVEFELPPACSNGVDDDGDTLADYPADPGCSSASDATETGVCGNATDDDGDGLVDFPNDPGCADLDDSSENALGLVCDDGLDNDGDTLIDFPADAGCFSPIDTTETTACSNGADDDGDGTADYPADAGCSDAGDESEQSVSLVCDDGVDNDGDLAIDFPADPGCVTSTDPSETTACSDAVDNDGDGLADLADAGCTDANDDSEKSPALVCDDGLDNDADLAIDYPADSGCASVLDADEITACENGLDDDGDGLADLADPGCADANDDTETSPALVCDDGLDNDGDTLVDFPADPGCASLVSDNESPQCNDGADNDGDTLIDLTDPGCASASDDLEELALPACSDGLDNDGDTLADFPADPGCASAASTNESPQCNDGVDNDGDFFIDLADPNCLDATDDVEAAPPVACSDGLDNDGDGLADYPADPGCLNATSNLENPRCDDDLDNDGDGGIDWDGGAGMGTPDPQCSVAFRDLETPNAPNCGLGTELVIAFPLLSALRRRTRRS